VNISEIRAYAAALVDGEGTIRVTRLLTGYKARYVPEVTVYNSIKDVLLFLDKHWGGDIRPKRRAISTHRQEYEWRVRRAKAKEFLRQIMPYLIIKREQAKLALACPLGKSGRDTTPSEYQKMEDIHKKITILNRRGRRAEQLRMELKTQEQLSLPI